MLRNKSVGVATVDVGVARVCVGVVTVYMGVCGSRWPLEAEGCKYLRSGKLNHFGFSSKSYSFTVQQVE